VNTKTPYQYVIDLREKLEETCKLPKSQFEEARGKQMKNYNRKAKHRQMKSGDKFLILLSTKSNKLFMQWRGSYEVIQRLRPMDYRVSLEGKIKTFHANMLRQYVERDKYVDTGILSTCCIVNIEDDANDGGTYSEGNVIVLPPQSESTEGINDIHISNQLDNEQQLEVITLASAFSQVPTDFPGRTIPTEHGIQSTTDEIVRMKAYPLPFSTKEVT